MDQRPIRATLSEGVPRPSTPSRSTLGASTVSRTGTPTRTGSPAAGRLSVRKADPLASSTLRRPLAASTSSTRGNGTPRPPASPSAGSAALRQEIMAAKKRAAQARANLGESVMGSSGGLEGVVVHEQEDAWGMPSLESVVQKARTSGRLNIGSRSLKALPSETWTLLPRSSPWHPSNRLRFFARKAAVANFDLSISARDDDDAEDDARWYETTELKTLAAGVNELEALDDALGGFRALQNLDLHHNLLASLPASLGLLSSLTSLTIRHNRLSGSFPSVLLALDNLTDLDVSDNGLTSLWPDRVWRAEVQALMKTAVTAPPREDADATDSPDQSIDSDDFHAFFPSSPTKPRRAQPSSSSPNDKSDAPFPNLKRLNLARNRLPTTFPPLPESLVSLDLSLNPFGKPIDLTSSPLKNLESLALAECGLSDSIFVRPSSTEAAFLPALKGLDLSANAMDSLAPLEPSLLGPDSATTGSRVIKYTGVPLALKKLVPVLEGGAAATETDGIVLVEVKGNFLRDEARRRRALRAAALPPSMPDPVAEPAGTNGTAVAVANGTPTPPRPTSTVAAKQDPDEIGWEGRLTEGEKRARRAEQARATTATADVDAAPSVDEPTVDPGFQLLLARYDAARQTIDLTSQHLTSLPAAPSPSTPAWDQLVSGTGVKTLDASKNDLDGTLDLSSSLFTSPALPSNVGLAMKLRTLRLARNRLTSLSLLPESTFPHLTELDLSGNRLTSTAETGEALLSLIARIGPGLEVVDLSLNALTSDSGIGRLLAPEGADGREGVRVLRLGDNRIAGLEELASVAESVGKGGRTGWACEELLLNDNDISKLPPALGWLPQTTVRVLSVQGNPFRIPNRKVYEGAGGTKSLLAWLKDRC